MTKLMYAIFLSAILFVACETTKISDEMENTMSDDLKVTAPMTDKSMMKSDREKQPMMKSNKQPMMKPMKK
ncbi:Lp6.6 family lipoprotein (plasmid) [Borrelia sp. CA_690]|uniref:Lp6.6 family lipoprotein n=1 Tax=Borrelia maritima TaxID=2761123 RepID=A0A5J6WDX9_9SPIR|nr:MULTISPECIES: Lp6.6 family lipoprotein [Borrelia]QFI14997.1 Lp6.6 family lipoprotein [Borrelia maritima]WKC84004.1 Lp6.6 family lipoprotein [Borrelia sp. CA_690]